MYRTIAVLAALLFAAIPARPQGFAWESTVTLPMGGGEGHVTTLYMPKMVKEVSADMHRSTIIRLDKELFITVNDEAKTYSEVTFEEMASRMKELGAMRNDKMAEMREKMKDLPPEQRKMVEQMMGGGSKEDESALSAVRDPKVETIAGYACTKSVYSRGDKEILSVWTTNGIKGYDALAADMRELSARLASVIPMTGKSLAEAYRKLDGFPMKVAAGSFSRTVTKVEPRSTPAAAFEPPAGYKKVAPDPGSPDGPRGRAGKGGKHD